MSREPTLKPSKDNLFALSKLPANQTLTFCVDAVVFRVGGLEIKFPSDQTPLSDFFNHFDVITFQIGDIKHAFRRCRKKAKTK